MAKPVWAREYADKDSNASCLKLSLDTKATFGVSVIAVTSKQNHHFP